MIEWLRFHNIPFALRSGGHLGPNLLRLENIKSRFDPDNVFRHAQSI